MPPLMLSDAELAARSPRDMELYAALQRVFKRRVHAMEARVNATVWGCVRADGGRMGGRRLSSLFSAGR